MAQAVPARLDAHFDVDRAGRGTRAGAVAGRRPRRHPHCRLRGSGGDRARLARLRAQADGTVFQTFDWLATWQRHIGARNGVRPAIVVGRDGAGTHAVPAAAGGPHGAALRASSTWLGSELCDYNAPLLARDVFRDASTARASWRCGTRSRSCLQAQSAPALRFRQAREDAGNGRRAAKSDAAPGRHDDAERRLSDPSHRRLGNVLRGQALVGDAPARPHQAQKALPSSARSRWSTRRAATKCCTRSIR